MPSSAAPFPPKPSPLTTLITETNTSNDPIAALTTQILHNLQHQHSWTSLRIHSALPQTLSSHQHQTQATQHQEWTGMPLISGIPPRRIYTHPDEQVYMLENGLREEDIFPEPVFVLPTARGQSWSLRKLAAVFDCLPDGCEEAFLSQVDDVSRHHHQNNVGSDEHGKGMAISAKLAGYYERRDQAHLSNEWGGKRLLLAMVDRGMGGDGTIVYYIIQEGTVKPRQN